MQYVTEEVAREIERAVEVITTDEQGFLREAALEYIRDNAPQDKVEGARYIRIVDGNSPTGVIGILTYDDGSCAPQFTLEGKTQSHWWELEKCRRISNLTAPEKPEPVKLYCVKPLSGWLTVGKVYESTDGWMTYDDDGRRVDSVCIREGHLFPLVSRPAKVGEYILLTEEPLVNDTEHLDGKFAVHYHKGDLVKITAFGSMPSVKSKDGKTHSGFREHEYLVLDGYDGRYEAQPEPPTDTHALRTENAMLERDNARLAEQNRHLENDIDEQRRQLEDLRSRIYNAKKALEGSK